MISLYIAVLSVKALNFVHILFKTCWNTLREKIVRETPIDSVVKHKMWKEDKKKKKIINKQTSK